MLTALIVAAGVALILFLRRGRRAFALSVRAGEVTLTSGWLPGPMLADYRSALRDVARGTVEGHFEEGGLRVTTSDSIDELVEQRLRNIARLYPLSSFRASRVAERQVAKATAGAAVVSLFSSHSE